MPGERAKRREANVGARMAFTLWLWRLWKWLLRQLTGKCEIQRLSESKEPLEIRTHKIEQSIRNSANQAVKSIALESSVDVEGAMAILTREKGMKPSPSLLDRLRPSLVRIHSLATLWGELDTLSQTPFSPDNEEHETTLAELWEHLMPDTALEARHTKQWQEIGFQGKDPATDFRGMGVLGLYCLHYLATRHQDTARAILSHSHHPQHHYPYAVVGIHITEMLHGWVRDAQLSGYLYTTCREWPVPIEELMEIYCYLFHQFDQFWLQKKPENVMAFTAIKEEFKSVYTGKLAEQNIKIYMRLYQTESFA